MQYSHSFLEGIGISDSFGSEILSETQGPCNTVKKAERCSLKQLWLCL